MEPTKICDGYIGLCRKHTTILFMPESNATYCGCFTEHCTFHDWIYVESLARARAQNAPYNVLSEHCSVFTNHRMKFVGMRMYDCVCVHVDTTDSRININIKSTHRIQSTVWSLRELAEFQSLQSDKWIMSYPDFYTTWNNTIVFHHKEPLPSTYHTSGERIGEQA